MDPDTKNIIAEQMAKLPPAVRAAIEAVDYPKKLESITKNNKLLIDQAGKLETETTLVLLGLEPLNDYVSNLSRELGVPKEKAITIAKDADELIFKGVRAELQKMDDEMAAADAANGSANAAATAAPAAPVQTPPQQPARADVLAGLERPHEAAMRENPISVSSLSSNNPAGAPAMQKTDLDGIEITNPMLPEIRPEAVLPMKAMLDAKAAAPYHENTPPVENIVAAKLEQPVVVPKQTVVVEEKTKLPPVKPETPAAPVAKATQDPYREPIG